MRNAEERRKSEREYVSERRNNDAQILSHRPSSTLSEAEIESMKCRRGIGDREGLIRKTLNRENRSFPRSRVDSGVSTLRHDDFS